jgi:hypothetical protein
MRCGPRLSSSGRISARNRSGARPRSASGPAPRLPPSWTRPSIGARYHSNPSFPGIVPDLPQPLYGVGPLLRPIGHRRESTRGGCIQADRGSVHGLGEIYAFLVVGDSSIARCTVRVSQIPFLGRPPAHCRGPADRDREVAQCRAVVPAWPTGYLERVVADVGDPVDNLADRSRGENPLADRDLHRASHESPDPSSRHDRQLDPRSVIRVVVDALIGDRVAFLVLTSGVEIAVPAGEAAAGDVHPQSMAGEEDVGGRP